MDDGRRYHVVDQYMTLVEQFTPSGELIERLEAVQVSGAVSQIEWSTDESGGVYF